MTQNPNVTVARGAFGAKCLEGVLRVQRITGQSCFNLLINNDIDFDACLGFPLQQMVQTVLLLVIRRAAQEELWRQPPVTDVDGLFSLFEGNGDGPEVVAAVDVPLDVVSFALGEVRFEPMGFAYFAALLVASLLVLFVVAVIGVKLFLRELFPLSLKLAHLRRRLPDFLACQFDSCESR